MVVIWRPLIVALCLCLVETAQGASPLDEERCHEQYQHNLASIERSGESEKDFMDYCLSEGLAPSDESAKHMIPSGGIITK
jgi:hypothetical protein